MDAFYSTCMPKNKLLNKKPNNSLAIAFYLYPVICVIALVFFIGISFFWNYSSEHQAILALAKKEAQTNFNKDLALRFWASEKGGFYVPVTEATKPNPHLSHIRDRDIRTTSGKRLTLINPAYMIRQVMDRYEKLYGVKGHITSLKPINPHNQPDNWERLALGKIENGLEEIMEISDLRGEPYLRFIRQVIVQKECLKCHGQQGYKVGDIRGGISVSVPLSPYLDLERISLMRILVSHILIGILGTIIILIIALQIKKRAKEQQLTQSKIFETNIELEQRVSERTKELEATNQKLKIKIHEAQQSEQQIKTALKEKETLLQEVHHRVKNNMQVICSLLDLQASAAKNQQAKAILLESQSCIHAMAVVHEILHDSDHLFEIDLQTYLNKITSAIFQTYSIETCEINLTTEVEPLLININQASHLGLITNELVSNSLKYAFPHDRKGEIRVIVKKPDNKLELTVMDDGIGIPEGINWRNSETLGLRLVCSLVEEQLGGSITMERKIGTKYNIRFKTGT